MTLASQLALERARSAVLWAAFERLLALRAKRRRGTAQDGSETARMRCSCGCNKTFIQHRSNQRYYSEACRKRAWRLRKELEALKLEVRQGRGSETQ